MEKLALEAGQILGGRYGLVARLGRGAMAEVWSALAPDGSTVALKIPRSEAFVRHLRRESLFLARVEHPNVARFLEAHVEDEPPFLVMELVTGEPLRGLCRGTIEPREATLLADQILAGLAAIHRAGIVHQDVKPENVIVEPSGRAKILDLGLGHAVASLMAEVYLSASLSSRELPLAGTLAYMSPEQRKGRPVDARADLFAFGVLLHELLSGRLPEPGTRLSSLRDDLTPRWDVAVAKLTHPNPDQRPRDADQARHLVAFTLSEKLTLPVAEGGLEPRELSAFDAHALEWVSPWSKGMVVGECELEAPLGRGGFGEVWRARRGEQEVAVKLALGPEAHAALAVEAEVATRLDHPGVPKVLDDRTRDDPPHVVFELVRGTSLRLRINEDGVIPLRDALEMLHGMCGVVAACHEAGVVHRDLKPEHFLIESGSPPRVTLIDFGLASLVSAPRGLGGSLASRGDVHGTFDYLAPEQRDGRVRGDERADVYALGVCLFEMLADDLPRGTQRLRSLRREVPQEIDDLALEMMRKDPGERPAVAGALAVVESVLASGPLAPQARRDGRPWHVRHRARIERAFLIAALLAVAVALVVVRRG